MAKRLIDDTTLDRLDRISNLMEEVRSELRELYYSDLPDDEGGPIGEAASYLDDALANIETADDQLFHSKSILSGEYDANDYGDDYDDEDDPDVDTDDDYYDE